MTYREPDWMSLPIKFPQAARCRESKASEMTDQLVQPGQIESASRDISEPVPMKFIALDDQGKPGSAATVELHQCDRHGISFHHPLPLNARRVLVSLQNSNYGPWEAEVELSWCRFNRMGHYTSGGRFVPPVRSTA